MNRLALHIEYLLLRHDCVVVPGFGAFLIHHESARFDHDGQVLLPPSQSVGFNQALDINDGVLVGSVARREGISYETARQRIEADVCSLLSAISQGKSVIFGDLGSFEAQENGVPVFTPNPDCAIINLPYEGLKSVALTPYIENRGTEDAASSACDSEPQVVKFPILLKIAASVVALFMAMGIFYTTMNMGDNSQQNYASLDSGFRQGMERVADVEAPVENLSREILLNIAIPKEEKTAEVAHTQSLGRYILVVGSFPTQRAANRFIGGRQGLNVIEMDGNYRIYASSAATLNEAKEMAQALSEDFPSVWVCRR